MKTPTTLELPFGVRCDTLYCPACGKPLVTPAGEGRCPHLAYVYIDEIGDFSYVAPRFERIAEVISRNERAKSHPVVRLAKKLASTTLLHFGVETGGMACGPVWSTVRVVIDFRPLE